MSWARALGRAYVQACARLLPHAARRRVSVSVPQLLFASPACEPLNRAPRYRVVLLNTRHVNSTDKAGDENLFIKK